jgi:hypothetical protein
MFGLDFRGNPLIHTEEIPQPGKELLRKVLSGHERDHKSLLEGDSQDFREEMIKLARGVEKDLLSLQGKRSAGNMDTRRSS